MNAKKKLRALIAAFIIAGLMAIGPIGIGVNAWLNTNTVPLQDAPAASQVTASSQTAAAQGQLFPAGSSFAASGAPILRTGGS